MSTIKDYLPYDEGRANYLTHISVKHHAVFVEVPKAGCTAVKRLLQLSAHEGDRTKMAEDVHSRKNSPLAMPRQGFIPDEIFGTRTTWYRFAFVRNPFSRALSCYLDKVVGSEYERRLRLPQLGYSPDDEVGFEEFLERVADQEPSKMDIHWTPQTYLLGSGRVRFDFLGRFECFQTDLVRVMDRIGALSPDDLVKTKTGHATNASEKMRQHYSDDAADLVRHIYREDFRRLGYGMDPFVA